MDQWMQRYRIAQTRGFKGSLKDFRKKNEPIMLKMREAALEAAGKSVDQPEKVK